MPDVRLIDENALAKWLDKEHYVDRPVGKCDERHNRVLGIAISALKNPQIAPTIDAVEVVRCRNCKLWKRTEKHYGKCPFLIGENQFTSEDGFCNLGEKMDGGASDGSD